MSMQWRIASGASGPAQRLVAARRAAVGLLFVAFIATAQVCLRADEASLRRLPEVFQQEVFQEEVAADLLDPLAIPLADDLRPSGARFLPPWLDVHFLARGFYLNDQRLEWTGMEATFGAEAALAVHLHRQHGDWDTAVFGDFYLNQRFDSNILADTVERRSYLQSWEIDVLEISNLWGSLRRDRWTVVLGKMETPFGRYYSPLLSNARIDAPFIRTEAIHWRETGLLVNYRGDLLVGDVALTNGTEDMDVNSSKALVSRIGLEGESWAVGGSIKAQDGNGSEWQKFYNAHLGLDWMLRRGRWILFGEVIYDEYGMRRDRTTQQHLVNPPVINWQQSIYHRHLNKEHEEPITGVGYYVELGYHGEGWQAAVNYGEFVPEQIGDTIHDQKSRRGIVKAIYELTPWMQAFGVVMMENEGFQAQGNRPRLGSTVLTGVQATF